MKSIFNNIYRQSAAALLTILLAALTLTACSSDPVVEPQQPGENLVPIVLGGGQEAQMEASTRVGERNLEDVLKELNASETPSFRVWAFKTMAYDEVTKVYSAPQTVMDRYIVQWTENTAGTTLSNVADWEYVGIENSHLGTGALQDIKYWDMSATSYRFFGFAPCNRLEPGTGANYTYPANHGDNYRWLDISFPADAEHPELAPYISNLWFANSASEGKYKYRDCVKMEFMKPVCKVRIKLLDMYGQPIENPQESGFTDLEFKPDGGAKIVQKGNLKVSYAITGPATIAHYTPSVTIEGDPTGTVAIDEKDDTYSQWYNVLPHVEQGAYQLVGHIGGKQKIAVVPAQYMSWQPNMSYTYVFKMTDQEFQFIDIVQVAVTEWRTEEDSHEVYNW